MKIEKAIITAGGRGERLLPCSKYVPKEMFPIGAIPAIDFALEECINNNILNICVVYGSGKECLISYLNDNLLNNPKYKNVRLTMCFQGNERGTAKAVELCADFIGSDPFYLIYPDELLPPRAETCLDMCELYFKTQKNILCVRRINYADCHRYGVIDYENGLNGVFSVKKIIEKPQNNPPSDMVLSGRYILDKKIFDKIKKIDKHGEEYFLTDALNLLAAESSVLAYENKATKPFDIGSPITYILSQLSFLLSNSCKDEDEHRGIKQKVMEIIEQGEQ